MTIFIAHTRKKDNETQSLEQHLENVSTLTKERSSKINMPLAGELIGLLHDLGKYSSAFQSYIRSASGILNPDIDEVDFENLKGKIDHSSAGAQWIWNRLNNSDAEKLLGQILCICIASHHSGLIDCLSPNGENQFLKRINKDLSKTHLNECESNIDKNILKKAKSIFTNSLFDEMKNQITPLFAKEESKISSFFYIGFLTKLLFSCLIDADRQDSANFEDPALQKIQHNFTNWDSIINNLENYLGNFKTSHKIDFIRQEISNNCKERANDATGIYTLTVPTGGGKTLASLRYAVHHAKKHKLDRIIYVIPYTSIIEQNAEAIRKAIGDINDEWVLEHHSNLEPEKQTWKSKLLAQNWDSPIILTTMVQFLEILFSGGTRNIRRLHQLTNSVIIFDEIQTLPIKCTYLFCNALNYLSRFTKTTAILCTATQPMLDKLPEPDKGALKFPKEKEIIKNVNKLFKDLKRVNIVNNLKKGGWSRDELLKLILKEYHEKKTCLVIVNTKHWAKLLFELCRKKLPNANLFHLSTNQCAEHRKIILKTVRDCLNNNLPVICVSTQLIEAGVDIDFACVIRFLAGLDSIAQAAGRCNRNGKLSSATVQIINPDRENIDLLPDIKFGKSISERILSEKHCDLLSPETIHEYFKYYFYERDDELSYPTSAQETLKANSLLNLLSENSGNINSFQLLRHSFKTAGDVFKSIDAPTKAVIVPYKQGKEIISELCAINKNIEFNKYKKLLKKAQQFSVNVFPNTWQKLVDDSAIFETQNDEGIFYLAEQYYNENFGLSTEITEKAEMLII